MQTCRSILIFLGVTALAGVAGCDRKNIENVAPSSVTSAPAGSNSTTPPVPTAATPSTGTASPAAVTPQSESAASNVGGGITPPGGVALPASPK